MLIVAIILIVLLIALVILGFALASFSMTGTRQTLEEARAWQEDHYDLSWYDPLEKTDYTVEGEDGYVLHVQYIQNPAPSDRYIIISHGYTDNRFGALKYGKMYLDLGFNLIVYDLRGHGLNEPTFCTYSARERKDLKCLIEDSRSRYPDAQKLGLHGESLGAATSVAVLEFRPQVDFVVADCGFSDIAPVLKGGLRGMHLPEWLVDVASICAKTQYGYSFSEMRPVESLRGNTVPMLLIHGAEDDFILPEHSRIMMEATEGTAEMYLVQGAGHAMSILTDPAQYAAHVASFLEKLDH
ncbi:MAG: alpha/beta hydrolase [Clostridia bacterium]|nr:alpha/beta hydrolase [Clostridia bacterium]